METPAPQRTDTPDEPLVHVVARLQSDFPSVEPGRIREVVELAHGNYRDARIRSYVTIFVEREARLRLRADLVQPPRESSEGSLEHQVRPSIALPR